MLHSSANLCTDSTLLEKVESKNETPSSSGDSMLNSSYEEVVSYSETEKTSCNSFTELSQISSTRDKRNRSQKPDENDNIILKRRKIQPEEAEQSISTKYYVPSAADLETCREEAEQSISTKYYVPSAADLEICREEAEQSISTKYYVPSAEDLETCREEAEQSSSPEYFYVPTAEDLEPSSSQDVDDWDSECEEALCIKLNFRPKEMKCEEENQEMKCEEENREMKCEEEIQVTEFLFEDVFPKHQDISFPGEVEFEAEIEKVTSATTENVNTKLLRKKFLHELHELWKICVVNNELDLNIEAKLESWIRLIIRLCKRKVLFSEKDNFIAYLILPVITPIVLFIELSVAELNSRVDLLRKKSALQYLVENFGKMQFNGTNLSSFLKKPFAYCNYLLDNVLLNLPVISCVDQYLEIDTSGLPRSHKWWFRKEYLHDMMPKEEHLRPPL